MTRHSKHNIISVMKDLMTKKDTADYLNLTTRSVDKLVEQGKLIKSKQGGKTIFKKENIQKYVNEYIKDEV